MKGPAKLAAINLFIAVTTVHLYAQGNFDLNNKQHIIVKRSYWSRENDDDTNNINIELINKTVRSVKQVTFEIVANDKQGTRLDLGSGYSKKLFSNKTLPPNSKGIYYFSNIGSLSTPPEAVQISNIHINYEDGSVENIRLEIK